MEIFPHRVAHPPRKIHEHFWLIYEHFWPKKNSWSFLTKKKFMTIFDKNPKKFMTIFDQKPKNSWPFLTKNQKKNSWTFSTKTKKNHEHFRPKRPKKFMNNLRTFMTKNSYFSREFEAKSSKICQHWNKPRGTWKQPFHLPPFSESNTSPWRFK